MDVPAREYVFGSVFLLANRLQTLGDNLLQEITLKQWFLLTMIHNLDKEQPSVTEIAAFIGSTRQNVRKMLEVLEAKGYVALVVNPQDKRNLSVTLTRQTRQFFAQFDAKGDAFLQQLFDGIAPEALNSSRQTFEALLQNLERMEETHGKSGGNL